MDLTTNVVVSKSIRSPLTPNSPEKSLQKRRQERGMGTILKIVGRAPLNPNKGAPGQSLLTPRQS